jgi:hypothetical protein
MQSYFNWKVTGVAITCSDQRHHVPVHILDEGKDTPTMPKIIFAQSFMVHANIETFQFINQRAETNSSLSSGNQQVTNIFALDSI